MVFTRTCESTRLLSLILRNLGINAIPISGQMSQAKRLGALNLFKSGQCKILVCSDVASRGLDIPEVDMVINYDIPSNSKVRKLIGARYFNRGHNAGPSPPHPAKNSPRDDNGYGSHTLSTAGCAFVPGANIDGCTNGTAKGGSPRARVAAYKVCWGDCEEADVLAGFDAAIHDGADVISVSLGAPVIDYFNDGTAIGSFHAVRKGITVVLAGGNDGPALGSVTNVAPWMLTVAASTIDRWFSAYVSFGDKKLQGESLSKEHLESGKLYPMINAKEANAANVTDVDASQVHQKSIFHPPV